MTIDTQDLIDAVQASLTPDLLSPQERARVLIDRAVVWLS